MDVGSLYQSKLTTPDQAVAAIPCGSKLSMGMAMAEPPALLKALADRAEACGIEELKVYYFEATRIAGETILRYEQDDTQDPILGYWGPWIKSGDEIIPVQVTTPKFLPGSARVSIRARMLTPSL
jgi:hypothetical protein